MATDLQVSDFDDDHHQTRDNQHDATLAGGTRGTPHDMTQRATHQQDHAHVSTFGAHNRVDSNGGAKGGVRGMFAVSLPAQLSTSARGGKPSKASKSGQAKSTFTASGKSCSQMPRGKCVVELVSVHMQVTGPTLCHSRGHFIVKARWTRRQSFSCHSVLSTLCCLIIKMASARACIPLAAILVGVEGRG